MDAVIILNKPEEMTSFSAVRNCRNLFREKKAGHTEPDDEKKYVIKNQQAGNREYIFDLSDCPVKIKEELSEIVLATDATDFCDENWLYAEILIQQIAFA